MKIMEDLKRSRREQLEQRENLRRMREAENIKELEVVLKLVQIYTYKL